MREKADPYFVVLFFGGNMHLQEFFIENPKVALGFSGGVDSAYLLYAAKRYGADVKAYYIKSQFQPEFELEDAKRLATELGAEMQVIHVDVLAQQQITDNPIDRCYHCKNTIFDKLIKAARADSYTTIIDGTNASDEVDDRPGMRALAELKVLSPLRICGLTKTEIRERSEEAGLFTWDKPAYACLATRIPTGEIITAEKLTKIEKAEAALFDMGYTDFRVRTLGNSAKLQMPAGQIHKVIEQRREITERLRPYFDNVLLDLEER